MNTLGIRAQPHAVVIAVVNCELRSIVNVERIAIPKALPVPEALKYARNGILDVLREFEIQKAGLRTVESNSQTLSIRRVEIEGVIQEAFASSTLSAYYCGQISKITKLIEIPRADFKKYVDGDKDYEAVEDWSDLAKEEREAVFAALGAEHV